MEYATKNVVHPFHQPNLFFLFFFFQGTKKIPQDSQDFTIMQLRRATQSQEIRKAYYKFGMYVRVCVYLCVCVYLSFHGRQHFPAHD